MNLLELLRAFFRLGVGEDDPAPDPAPDPDPDPAPDPADDLSVDDPADDPAPDPDKPSGDEVAAALDAVKAEKTRADRAERELSELRTPRPRVDDVTRQEDERLADPKITPAERWQIESNRVIRSSSQQAAQALIRAEDVSDKTSFATIAIKNPALFKRYEARVEEQLSQMRAKGFNAPRESIMDNLIGKDMRDGKFKAKKAADEKTTVPRGKLPGARSDVSGKNAMSEHEKRKQRLENVQI